MGVKTREYLRGFGLTIDAYGNLGEYIYDAIFDQKTLNGPMENRHTIGMQIISKNFKEGDSTKIYDAATVAGILTAASIHCATCGISIVAVPFCDGIYNSARLIKKTLSERNMKKNAQYI
ncbi:MAG: hypothetical protein PHU12_02970 [Candidatus Aenigmarchaeota archaeon]|nr:hypothetical protein [Candidatus Aenigmarchaeota archaeon]